MLEYETFAALSTRAREMVAANLVGSVMAAQV
jgi:hypothetical protein